MLQEAVILSINVTNHYNGAGRFFQDLLSLTQASGHIFCLGHGPYFRPSLLGKAPYLSGISHLIIAAPGKKCASIYEKKYILQSRH
ncbi:MAG: hypothetical protein LJU34_05810, partial [Oscillospiraceae bacterium]|nr:hypothetical protein [Oscillospiraceae bacterium]